MNNEFAGRIKIMFDELTAQKMALLDLTQRYTQLNANYNNMVVEVQEHQKKFANIKALDINNELAKADREIDRLMREYRSNASKIDKLQREVDLEKSHNEFHKKDLASERATVRELIIQRNALSASNKKLQEELKVFQLRGYWR